MPFHHTIHIVSNYESAVQRLEFLSVYQRKIIRTLSQQEKGLDYFCFFGGQHVQNYFLRLRLTSFDPPDDNIFTRYKCGYVRLGICRWQASFQIMIIRITSSYCPFLPVIKFRNKMQTPIKSVCIEVILLL